MKNLDVARVVTAPAREGTLAAIPSKSDAHRALIAAALAEEPTEILCAATSDDILATVSCLAALGASVETVEGGYRVSRGTPNAEAVLDACESGSTLRFLLPIAAALGGRYTFIGRGRLPERPLTPLTAALRAGGATLLRAETDKALPLTVLGGARAGVYEISGNVSSQYVTGLLFALPLLGGASQIRLTTPLESAPYVEMTLRTLSKFGVLWQREGNGFLLSDKSRYRSPSCYRVEGDWSSAAFPLVSGALGGRVTVRGLRMDSLQADRKILDALSLAGASVTSEKDAVTASGGSLRPFTFDVSSCPDLFPVLAVLAAGAVGESRLTGGARLRLKESNRIATTAAMLRALGGEVREEDDGVTVIGRGSLSGGTVDGAGDHRIVMAAATARGISDGDITVLGARAAGKSYPTYFDDHTLLKGASHEIILR